MISEHFHLSYQKGGYSVMTPQKFDNSTLKEKSWERKSLRLTVHSWKMLISRKNFGSSFNIKRRLCSSGRSLRKHGKKVADGM